MGRKKETPSQSPEEGSLFRSDDHVKRAIATHFATGIGKGVTSPKTRKEKPDAALVRGDGEGKTADRPASRRSFEQVLRSWRERRSKRVG